MRKLTTTLCLILTMLVCSEVSGSDLPPCKPTIYKSETSLWDKCVGSWKYKSPNPNKAEVYEGEWRDGKKHGQGTYTFASGSKYVGKFRGGKKHGQGIYTFAKGDKYIGEFKEGKKHGKGTYTFANGDRYIGEFMDGKIAGRGTYIFTSGKIYKGVFKDGKLSTPINSR